MKTKIAVFFGGRSVEHDVSIITANQAMQHLSDEKYEIFPIYMKNGAFFVGEMLKDISFFENFNSKKVSQVYLIDGVFYTKIKSLLVKKFKPDVALDCCHGGEGENGVLQGVLEYNNIPYTSAGVLASALGMDKILAKDVFQNLLLNTIEGLAISREDFLDKPDDVIRHLETFLDYPVIVKPSSLGSSIGIKVAQARDELMIALEVASAFDSRILVERALSDFVELNCAVVSNGYTVFSSEVEKPISWNSFLTFEDKYLSENGKGMNHAGREMPAKIDAELYELVKKTSEKIYIELNLSGVVRFDFMLSKGKLYINEMNTIPGSMAFYLFEPIGINFSQLLDMIIEGAKRKDYIKKKSKMAFDSQVIKNFSDVKGKCLQK